MTEVNLSASAQVTLDGSGNGTARIGPISHAETWSPLVASVRVAPKPPATATVLSPVCKIYVGPLVKDTTFLDGTYTGEADSMDNIRGNTMRLGDYVWAVWTGGDAGAQATVTVTGSKEIP